jgi:hypothetical protein
MASHSGRWVLGAHVRFGSLDFFVTAEGGLAQAHVLIRLLRSVDLDSTIKALEELRLHAPKTRASGSDQLLDFDYERLEHQLDAFLGPRL